MNVGFDFAHPWLLLLLPLALLPLRRAGQEALQYSNLSWLPADRAGRIIGMLGTAFAITAIFGTVLALAGPGQPQTEILRTGRGAEILVLMDRSRSMDLRMLPSDWRTIDPIIRTQQAWHRGPQKSKTARDLLSTFIDERSDDRFSLMFFSGGPLLAVPFTQHDEVLQAAITAAGVGVGLTQTDVGRALATAIAEFAKRPYSGSRIILLVSDGGAHLDSARRAQIAAGLSRHRIALYWFYLRSINSPALDSDDPSEENTPEIALHGFFNTLATPYHAYQAEVPEDLARAVADVGKQQNLPLDFVEHIPRRDYSRHCLALAAFSCAMLLIFRALQLRSWS